MESLCFALFAKIVQSALQPPNDDKDIVELLLSWITEKESVVDKKGNSIYLAPSLVSDLLNRKVNVPKVIKAECTTNKILAETISHFSSSVIPMLNPYMSSDMYGNLQTLIDSDTTITAKKKKELNALYDCSKDAEFLAQLFLYVVNRENRVTDSQVEHSDIPLLTEANFECPICHAPLVEYVRQTSIKKYSAVKIYPEDIRGLEDDFAAINKPSKLDVPANLILLCRDHAEEYTVSPNIDDYFKLKELKERLVASNKLRTSINDASLEDEIVDVLQGLSDITDQSKLIDLPLSALRIDQKILPENHMLRADETARVLKYYNYINNLFSSMDRKRSKTFEHIASEIHIAYEKLDDGTLTQDEIVQMLSEWIRNKSKLGTSYNRACDIVVAFFIQNCEVFDEIPE